MEFKSENVLHVTPADMTQENAGKGTLLQNCSLILVHQWTKSLDDFKGTPFYAALAPRFGKDNPTIILTPQ